VEFVFFTTATLQAAHNGAGEKAFRRLAGEETLFNYSPTLLDNICDAQRYRALVWQVGGRVKNKRQKFSQPPLAACCVVASF
jgi:maltooligosyltrehalose synthase